MPEKITLRRLREMLQDDTVTEQQLRPYIEVDEDASRAFAPALRVNWTLVDNEGLEGDVFLGIFNTLSKKRRQARYRKKIADGWSGLRIVAEGDSWFQYPILLEDVVDQLFDRYAIFCLGEAGDLLSSMLREDEITAAITNEKPDVFLISGGGNDLVGDSRLATMLHPFADGRKPEEYPNARFVSFLQEIASLYRQLFTRLTARFSGLRIVCHGYDRAIPTNGKWLGKPLEKLGIRQKQLQREIVGVIIDRFNDTLKTVANDFPGVVFPVDCRGAVGDHQWHDELHPTDDGFKAVSNRFTAVIEAISPRREVFRGARPALCPGRERMVADAKDLDPASFRRLVAHRARELCEANVGLLEQENERRALEGDISNFFEKIHKGADFLPARFLADGAARALAVCRIVVPDGFGTGFLVANRTSIMTNNHVLPNLEAARGSVAEFGFEDGMDVTRIPLDPQRLFLTDEALDFTIVGCDATTLAQVAPVPLLRSPATVTRGERVNIIQHPGGRPKEIAIYENDVTRVLDKVIRYRTDTEPGSSGSPVFNGQWDLVALHHAGWAEAGGAATNEGIRIAAIVAHLLAQTQRGTAVPELVEMMNLIPDSSPLLGFFDVHGVTAPDGLEVEVPHFTGTGDFIDAGFWNIEHFNGDVSTQRVGRVADVLAQLSMDVMGLVEVEKPALERLVRALRDRGSAAEFRVLDTPGRQDLAILFDSETATVELATDINQRHGTALAARTRAGLKAFPREPLFARCQVRLGNVQFTEFMMIVVHFKAFGDAQSRARRRLAAKLLAQIIDDVREQTRLPVVLGGDFNESLNTEVLGALTGSPDLFAMTSDDALTNAATFVGGSHLSLIDHIIVSKDVRPGDIMGDDAAIVRLDKDVSNFTRDISDHVPIVFRMVGRTAPLEMAEINER
jgi:endonuclease/exonuclease/phosphatase family metal-dependent hydrolase/S1-C subfamily serine protease